MQLGTVDFVELNFITNERDTGFFEGTQLQQ